MKLKAIKKKSLKGKISCPASDADKYTRGELVIIGGSNEYPGAACMAAEAGNICGAGYVEVFCDTQALPIVHAFDPEFVAKPWADFPSSSKKLREAKEGHPKACLIGSGFSGSGGAEAKLLGEAIGEAACPVVVDGGALGLLASAEGVAASKERFALGRATVLTPHYGEAAHLASAVGIDPVRRQTKTLESDSEYVARLSKAYGAIVVLKGPKTIIADAFAADGKGVRLLMDKGPACLAKAGTGDVLAGMTASFLAQGISPMDACELSTSLHALSARLAQKKLTPICVLATDIIKFLPKAFNSLSS